MLANLPRLGWRGQSLLKIGKLVEGRPFHVYVGGGAGGLRLVKDHDTVVLDCWKQQGEDF